MSPTVIRALITAMGTREGKSLLSTLGKDPNVDSMILRGLGMNSKPTAQDISDAKALFDTYNSTNAQSASDVVKQIRNVMMMDPKARAIMTGVRALSEGTRAIGNMATSHANRLAEALLATNRIGGDQQRSMYGTSMAERAADAYGKNKIRKAEMAKHATDAIANTIDKAIGDYSAQDTAARAMSAMPYMQGTPGALYQMINGMQSRASKVTP